MNGIRQKRKLRFLPLLGITAIFIVCITVFSAFSACDFGSKYDNESVVDGVVLLRNQTHKKSLAARCEWDGDMRNMQFTVPDEYCGYKVVCLGEKGNPGFSGRPSPFSVSLPDELDGLINVGGYTFIPEEMNAENTVILDFTVNIGKYVAEIERLYKSTLIGYGVFEGEYVTQKYYRVNIYYNIDAENTVFYSKNGDVYYKATDKIYRYS